MRPAIQQSEMRSDEPVGFLTAKDRPVPKGPGFLLAIEACSLAYQPQNHKRGEHLFYSGVRLLATAAEAKAKEAANKAEPRSHEGVGIDSRRTESTGFGLCRALPTLSGTPEQRAQLAPFSSYF